MSKITIFYGSLLVLLGVLAYYLSGMASFTAFIPSVFGAVFIALGLAAANESLRKHVMHAAVVVALLGLFGTFRGLTQLPQLMSGADLERPMAVASQSVMAMLTIVFIGFCVNSFIQARKAQKS